MSEKIKVLTLGDHPLSPSGVGMQSRYIFEALLKTGNFEIISLGGAIKHQDYTPTTVEGYENQWKIIPVDGYGNPEMIRSLLRNEKPDILWMMTDPRFYGWLWQIENEVRSLCPIVYYHVWDNYPAPMFNKVFYDSNDHVACISRLTHNIVKEVSPDVPSSYLPHAVNDNLFAPIEPEIKKKLREENLEEVDRDKFIVFWNNRNARRKQSGSLVFWWKDFLDKYDLHDKAQLIMHTDPKDVHGQDLVHIINHLGLNQRQVLFSTNKLPPEAMPSFYQMADVTINVADAEGFGLSTFESLASGVPIIATMTGGLQEQVTSGTELFGVPIFPTSKAIIGSQQVPYIYEDRVSGDQVVSALNKMYTLGEEGRREMGLRGRAHIMNNYSFENYEKQWVKLMTEIYEKHGSWDTRKEYNGITFKEVA
jgi:glycosyltransferase involved in cell wall biosynthesis